jgi:hypothetical protein
MSDPDNEPPWFTALVDQRLALVDEVAAAMNTLLGHQTKVIFIPMTEPPENATPAEREAWEYRCDHCGKDCRDLHWKMVTARREYHGMQVHIQGGLCLDCAWA